MNCGACHKNRFELKNCFFLKYKSKLTCTVHFLRKGEYMTEETIQEMSFEIIGYAGNAFSYFYEDG